MWARSSEAAKRSLETQEAERNGDTWSFHDDKCGVFRLPAPPIPAALITHRRTQKTARHHLLTSKQVRAKIFLRCCAIYLHRIREASRAYPSASCICFFRGKPRFSILLFLPPRVYFARRRPPPPPPPLLNIMSIVLPELPWAKDSLAPHISSEVSMYTCNARRWHCSHRSAEQGQQIERSVPRTRENLYQMHQYSNLPLLTCTRPCEYSC